MPAPAPIPPASVQLHSVVTHDVDDQAAALAGWQQRYQQLSPGTFVGELIQGRIGESFEFFHEKTNRRLSELVVAPAGRHTFALVSSPRGDASVNDLRARGDCLLNAPPTTGFEAELPEDTSIDALTVSSDELSDYAQAVIDRGGDRGPLFDQVMLKRTPLTPLLRGFCEQVRSACAHPAALLEHPQTQRAMRSAAISNILYAISSDGGDPVAPHVVAQRRYRIVQLARQQLESDLSEIYTVADLCRTLGVSRRTLQYCFEDVLQINPIAYIRAMRLNAVRRDLKRADPRATTVADIASQRGFWHLSHFSADYKRMFGELPSVTLSNHKSD